MAIKFTASIGYTFTMDDEYLIYQSAYGKRFKVLRADIEAVAVGAAGGGKGLLRVIGHGTDLASVELPSPWAEKAAEWIREYRQGPIPEGPAEKQFNVSPKALGIALGVAALFGSCVYSISP